MLKAKLGWLPAQQERAWLACFANYNSNGPCSYIGRAALWLPAHCNAMRFWLQGGLQPNRSWRGAGRAVQAQFMHAAEEACTLCPSHLQPGRCDQQACLSPAGW